MQTSRPEAGVASGFGVGAWAWNLTLREFVWSADLCAIYGVSPDATNANFETFLSLVHPDDRASVIATVSKTVATRRAGHEQRFKVVRPDGKIRHLLSRARLTCDGDGEPILLSGVNIDLGDCWASWPDAERSLSAREDRFRASFKSAPTGYVHLSPEGRCVCVNERFCQLTGFNENELIGQPLQELVRKVDRDLAAAHMEIIHSGASDNCSFEKQLIRKDGTFVPVLARLSRVRTSSGEIDFVLAGFDDIEERKLGEHRQQTLLKEMSHRGKNLLSVIQSISRRTLSGDRTLEEARDALNGRLEALSHTYDTLNDPTCDGVEIEVVLRKELASFSERVHLEGPRLLLTPKATQTLALITHELATNTCKYGALSVPAGHLIVKWYAAGDAELPALRFSWHEEGGPPARPPSRRGFGTTLISVIAGAEFGCEPELIYGDRGFRYEFEAQLSRIGLPVIDTPVRRKLKNPAVRSLYESWIRQRAADGSIPDLAAFDWTRFAETGSLSIAKLTVEGDLQFVQIGRALTERLGGSGDEIVRSYEGNLAGRTKSYLQCARKGEPRHEYVRFDFGDDDPITFESLLVPFSSTPHRLPTHVVGIVVFEGRTGNDAKQAG